MSIIQFGESFDILLEYDRKLILLLISSIILALEHSEQDFFAELICEGFSVLQLGTYI